LHGLTFLSKLTLGKKPCRVLMDTGATLSFIDAKWLAKMQCPRQHCQKQGRLRFRF